MRRVSPLPNRAFDKSRLRQLGFHLDDSAPPRGFEAHAEALQPCRERPTQVMPATSRKHGMRGRSADMAFDQPVAGVPRSPGERSTSSCVPSARIRQPSAGCYGRLAPSCRRARARRSSPHIVQRPGFGVRLWSSHEPLCNWRPEQEILSKRIGKMRFFLSPRRGAAQQWLLMIIGGSAMNCR